MKVEIIKCLKDNFSYLLINEKNKNACVIDPSESEPIIDFVEKNNITLKFILNTHHHYDHVGGNIELKKKFNSQIIGFKGDKNRIPEIDILVEDNEIWKADNFEAKIFHIPGHTKGHISFFFHKDKFVFTGDTLFSLGCGRIFEGTYQEMFNSLNKIKNLPKDTKIYCGHEYTLQNSKFCLKYDSKNTFLKEREIEIQKKLSSNQPTIPTTLGQEIKTNIFFRCNEPEIKHTLGLKDSSEAKVFSKLRDLKDSF